jgi:hypothetical protein
MTAIKLSDFAGQIPVRDNRLLPDNAAALTSNVWLYSGRIESIRAPKLVHTLQNSAAKRVFRIPKYKTGAGNIVDSYWLEFNVQDVDVVKAPTDNDAFRRFYWAGEGDINGTFPRYNTFDRIAAAQPYFRLGVPAPGDAPVVTTSPSDPMFKVDTMTLRIALGNVNITVSEAPPSATVQTMDLRLDMQPVVISYTDSQNVTTYDSETTSRILDPTFVQSPSATVTDIIAARAYTYTWVTAYGEEGPPAEPVVCTGKQGDHWNVTVSAPTTDDSTFRNLTKTRIYRTVTSQTGQATYYLVAELPIATLTYQDDKTDTEVVGGTALESTQWTAPPADLRGFVSMPNGMLAGFRANELWFCEPYRPHAWPSPYTLTVDYDIIGLGVIGQTVIVCTGSGIYGATGTHPSVVSMAQMGPDACVSRGSIVTFKDGVYFAGTEGMMRAGPGGVENLTQHLMSRDYWQTNHSINTIHGARLGDAYFGGSVIEPGCFEATAFEATAFEQIDFTNAYAGFICDRTTASMSYVRWGHASPTLSICNDPWTGEVLIVRNGGVYQLDTTLTSYEPYTWRSKVFEFDKPKNLGAMRVFFVAPPNLNPDLPIGRIKVWANHNDGMRVVLDRPLAKSGDILRLPSGFLSEYWQFEFTGYVRIWSAQVASTVKELTRV